MNRKQILLQALELAQTEVLKFDPNSLIAEVKSTAGDLVSAADIASQDVIGTVIRREFPEDIIVSEESPESHKVLDPNLLPELTGWILDPIDGSNNFVKGMAYSGISIAYVEKGEVVIGGVCDPYRKDIFIAEKDHGATRNGESITVSNVTDFNPGTRVATSNSHEGGTVENLKRYQNLGHVWVDVLGSAVLIMTDVACGRLDLYHHNGLKPWDNAAAFLIADEAGAKLTDLQGNPVNWLSSEIVLGNPSLVDLFIDLSN